MIKSVIVESDELVSQNLKQQIDEHCPDLEVIEGTISLHEAASVINDCQPNLVFLDTALSGTKGVEILNRSADGNYEVIMLSDHPEAAVEAIKYRVSGFLLKPVELVELLFTIQSTVSRIQAKNGGISNRGRRKIRKLPHHNIIGIPTMEGFEFLKVEEIIRCEGLQKCTRVVTTLQSDIISSYNIGKFKKLLDDFGFFQCHKSHLINLAYVRKYTHEGFIHLHDQSSVPLARRRKNEFMTQLNHL
ncbi:MAG: LytTR family DNA-binding domain-containing protein [Balneolaceae bacterium]|nr:LytTR family DNA-binding domain-containing protein [Balneolaceae bacterium]